MTEKRIAMHARSVNGIREGRKTQTRRIARPQPPGDPLGIGVYAPERVDKRGEIYPAPEAFGMWGEDWDIPAPYQPGDILWVAEDWAYRYEGYNTTEYDHVAYKADRSFRDEYLILPDSREDMLDAAKWRPRVTMPKGLHRLTLRVTDVRVERVQDISEEDAKAEGVSCSVVDPQPRGIELPQGKPRNYCTNRELFADLWDDTNGPGAWDRNDWVFVYEFAKERHK